MARIAFRGRILPGARDEYIRRHRAVDPGLLADLKQAGARNYTIYLSGDDLFGYLEVDDLAAYETAMSASRANQAWQAEMRTLVSFDLGATDGQPTALREVFRLD